MEKKVYVESEIALRMCDIMEKILEQRKRTNRTLDVIYDMLMRKEFPNGIPTEVETIKNDTRRIKCYQSLLT